MEKSRIPKLTFVITPNPNGYMVGCNEITYLFTDVNSLVEIDKTIKNLLSDYITSFPDDAEKRGVDVDTLTQTIWRGTPNSVALE